MNKRYFFDLLHVARTMKHWRKTDRQLYLCGMIRMFLLHIDDIRAGQNMKGYWQSQQSGAE